MMRIGVWHIASDGPSKLTASSLDLEQQLETWIEREPSLLENGLRIIGRQVSTDAGPLDLLALDPQDRLVVIELKRGKLRREAVAQALDYAACVATMSNAQIFDIFQQHAAKLLSEGRQASEGAVPGGDDDDAAGETREVRIFVVGTGRDAGIDRIMEFLSQRSQIPISAVTFEVFQLIDGQQVLVRQLTDVELESGDQPRAAVTTLDELRLRAERKGVGSQFRILVDAGIGSGLYPRLFPKCVMFAPPSRRSRALFTVWAKSSAPGEIVTWLGPEVVAEFYPITEEEVRGDLGDGGYRYFTGDTASAFAASLDRLFATIRDRQAELENANGDHR